jgi:hypothetical protein
MCGSSLAQQKTSTPESRKRHDVGQLHSKEFRRPTGGHEACLIDDQCSRGPEYDHDRGECCTRCA